MQGAAGNLDASRHWLTLLARRYRADLLHVNGYAHARNQTGLPTLAVAHSDVLSWWRAVHREAAPREWQPYRREVVAGLRAADRVVAPTARRARRSGAPLRIRPRLRHRDPERHRYTPFMRRSQSAPRSWRPAGCGTRRRTSPCSTPPPPLSTGRSRLPGRRATPRGVTARLRVARALGVLNSSRNGRAARRRPRSSRRRHGTSLLALVFSKPPPAAARWCSATFRRCARTGTAPRCSSPPDDAGGLAHDAVVPDRLTTRGGRRSALRRAVVPSLSRANAWPRATPNCTANCSQASRAQGKWGIPEDLHALALPSRACGVGLSLSLPGSGEGQ